MTRISLDGAAVGSGLDAEVPPVSLSVDDGAPVVIAVEGDERPLFVSMLLGGRLRPDSGRALIDGAADDAALRSATAIVDAPWVSEPTAGIRLRTIVAEEFSFAALPSSRRAVDEFLARHGLADYAGLALRALPAAARIRLFSELAVLRDGVRCIIVTSPERHGAAASEWYTPLAAITSRGIAVAIVTDFATAAALIELGAREPAAPFPPTPLTPPQRDADPLADTDADRDAAPSASAGVRAETTRTGLQADTASAALRAETASTASPETPKSPLES